MKTDLIYKLTTNRDELLNLILDLSAEQLTTIPIIEEWTIKDIVGHISYWEQVIHDHVRESYTEGRPRPMSNDESDDAINARESAKRRNWSWQRVRAEFENTRRALIERIESLSESELAFQVPNPWWNEKRFYSVAQMIEEDAIGHANEHIRQIIKWKQEVGAKDAKTPS